MVDGVNSLYLGLTHSDPPTVSVGLDSGGFPASDSTFGVPGRTVGP